MEVRFTRSKLGTIVLGIAGIILGVLMFMNPGSATEVITLAVGWTLVVTGIISLVNACAHWSIILSQMDLYNGILNLLMGMLIVNWPGFFVAWIFILLGIYILVSGFNLLFSANALQALGVRGAGWSVVGAILAIVLGFLVMWSPFSMASASMMICGIALVYTGIVNVVDGFRMKPGEEE